MTNEINDYNIEEDITNVDDNATIHIICQERENCMGCPFLEDNETYWYCSAREIIQEKGDW